MTDEQHAGWMTMSDGSRVPVSRDDADAILAEIEAADKRRAEDMPTAEDAIKAASRAFERLRDLGWNYGMYAPKDGTKFDAVSVGSSGIHRVHYEAPCFWCADAGDLWPYDVAMFRLDPADAQKRAEKMAAAARAFREEE